MKTPQRTVSRVWWTIERLKELRDMSDRGVSVYDVAAHFRVSWVRSMQCAVGIESRSRIAAG